MQIHYFFLENIAKSGLGGESSLWFLFKSIKKNCRFRRIQGGTPRERSRKEVASQTSQTAKVLHFLRKGKDLRSPAIQTYIVFPLELLLLARRNYQKYMFFLQYFYFSCLSIGGGRQKCIVFAVPNGHQADMGSHQK